MKQKILNGIPAAPGISIGKAYLFDKKEVVIQKKSVKKDEISAEIKKFKAALTKTRKEIMEIRDKISREIGSEHGEIFSAHLLVLEDSMLIDEVISRVTEEKLVVEYIFSDVLKKYIRAFSKIDDEYLRERISDINDIGKRIIKNLVGAQHSTLGEIKKPAVVVAYDLSPSDTATMHKKTVTAFATDIGGRTSHTAIMAKSLEIPAVVGLEEATEVIKNGDTIIVDGNRGKVILHPAIATLKQYESEKKVYGEE
ncbi:MAG: phosphoenolpyruvate-utilizing N-terminal domain-containing protein, partial [Candidatus Omnitrophota bacterium]